MGRRWGMWSQAAAQQPQRGGGRGRCQDPRPGPSLSAGMMGGLLCQPDWLNSVLVCV